MTTSKIRIILRMEKEAYYGLKGINFDNHE